MIHENFTVFWVILTKAASFSVKTNNQAAFECVNCTQSRPPFDQDVILLQKIAKIHP